MIYSSSVSSTIQRLGVSYCAGNAGLLCASKSPYALRSIVSIVTLITALLLLVGNCKWWAWCHRNGCIRCRRAGQPGVSSEPPSMHSPSTEGNFKLVRNQGITDQIRGTSPFNTQSSWIALWFVFSYISGSHTVDADRVHSEPPRRAHRVIDSWECPNVNC